jgi:hypothetical protein
MLKMKVNKTLTKTSKCFFHLVSSVTFIAIQNKLSKRTEKVALIVWVDLVENYLTLL